MKNVSQVIPCYAADTSGVCSALYELGGMVVVHDASGCNSTYSTHDEPRWYDKKSMIYISALTEMDMIMGNDEKLISDIVSAARDQRPEFIALCGSPMPMMTGFDYRAVARDIQGRSGIRTFGIPTTGTYSYIKGAGQAFLEVVRAFSEQPVDQTRREGVNILGTMPLDWGLTGSAESISDWVRGLGFQVCCELGMNGSLDKIRGMASAQVSLVVSYAGLEAAEYLLERFGVPYVCGAPIGGAAEELGQLLIQAAAGRNERSFLAPGADDRAQAVVIGEGVQAGSLARAIKLETGLGVRVISPLTEDRRVFGGSGMHLYAEEDIRAALEELRPEVVAADPLYRYIIPEGTRHWELPHFAFSGRCFARDIPDLIGRPVGDFING